MRLKTSQQGCLQFGNLTFKLILKKNGRKSSKVTFQPVWFVSLCSVTLSKVLKACSLPLQLMHLRHDWLLSTVIILCAVKNNQNINSASGYGTFCCHGFTVDKENWTCVSRFVVQHYISVASRPGARTSVCEVIVICHEQNRRQNSGRNIGKMCTAAKLEKGSEVTAQVLIL